MQPWSSGFRGNLLTVFLCFFCLTATIANAGRKPLSSLLKKHKMMKQFKHISDDEMDSIFQPYTFGSPLNLPPYDSLSPTSLPNHIDSSSPPYPYCIYPPISFLPPPGGSYDPSPITPIMGPPSSYGPSTPIIGPPSPPSVFVPSPITPITGSSGSSGPPSAFIPSPTTPVMGPPGPPSVLFPSPITPVTSPPGQSSPITPIMSPPGPPSIVVPSPITPVMGPPSGFIPSPPSIVVPSPTTPVFGPPAGLVPSPLIFLPPIVYPPPAVPPPPHRVPKSALWCVAKPTVPDPIIQEAMNYACGSGADCDSVQPNGPCFQPDTLLAHASYAFNSYWQRTKVAGGTCEFGGTAILVTVDPSYDGCHFLYF